LIDTIQYNILLLPSQTDRFEGDIYKYNSITNRQLPRRTIYCGTVLWLVTTGINWK